MIAILTDKPNVGKEIARILGAQTRENGYMTGNGYMVTWTFGNMLSLAMPKDYGIERPEREAFPLNPAPFKLMVKHVKTDTGWVPDINAVLQLKVIEKVFAACDTIIRNLEDFERKEEDYDRIITGDLGYVGQSILFDLMREKEYDIKERHMDCGMTIFDQSRQDTHAGGSGCGCAAATLSAYILPAIASGEWKRVLFVPTGALMSTVSYNEGASVPGIAHGIVLEHC